MTYPLPKGANFKRGKFLWELGLHVAGNPSTPQGGNRDMMVVVGSGSGEALLGWRAGPLDHGRFAHRPAGHTCIDFSGWPLYCAASLPEKTVYEICGAFGARHDEMPWEEGAPEGLGQIGRETDATPMDVPLYAGVARWHRERGLAG